MTVCLYFFLQIARMAPSRFGGQRGLMTRPVLTVVSCCLGNVGGSIASVVPLRGGAFSRFSTGRAATMAVFTRNGLSHYKS